MKKQSLLLITGGLLAMASCNTEPAATADNSQAKIDSMVNERVEQIRLELQAQNDSIINEMALYRADSIIAARTGKKPPARPKPTPPSGTGTSNTQTTEETPRNPKEGRFNGEGTDNTTKKESRFSEDAAEKQKEAEKSKKEDRFK
ncbi:MAG: hypothetical protein H3C54_10180 [Taibaiella sp.]|nr:hypothetical protein [Taibaiella sp.]